MRIGKSCAIIVASALLLIFAISTIVSTLATLPGYLDEFLLTNDEYCYPSLDDGAGNDNFDASGRKMERPSVQVDYGEYEPKMVLNGQKLLQQEQLQMKMQQQHHQYKAKNVHEIYHHVANSVLRRISLHFWEESTKEDPTNLTATEDVTTCPIDNDDTQQQTKQNIGQHEMHGEEAHHVSMLHPMCENHRKFRSRLRFQQLIHPWNWYYRNHLIIRGLNLHSSTTDVAFESVEDNAGLSWLWKLGWNIVSGKNVNSARVKVVPRSTESSNQQQGASSSHSLLHLPPSLEIDTVDISFQSWERPIVSTQMHGIVVNVVIQKGGFPLPLQHMTGKNNSRSSGVGKAGNNTALLIGDMTISEVLGVLPRPPEIEGLYPRIGVMNITNVTLCVYEIKSRNDASLNLLLKTKIPDKFFLPITNLTLAHKQTGIDQKHFQSMMESSMSMALRGHLLREATTAFHNSWVSAHKAQEQIQQFVLQTQELYLDRWIEMGVQAWHQTQQNVWQGVVNGTLPLVKAVEDWVFDVKEIFSEPAPPLALVLSHHWNRTVGGLNKYGISIDKQIWGHINETYSAKMNQIKREKKISKHLDELRESFDGFIAKSGKELELFVKSCEMEAKEMWLEWHRQFMPQL